MNGTLSCLGLYSSLYHHFTWEVPNFFSLSSEPGYFLQSAEFRVAGDLYCLRLYPHGTPKDEDVDIYVDIVLVRLTSSAAEKDISFEIGYKSSTGEYCSLKRYYYCPVECVGREEFFVQRSKLEKNKATHVPDDKWTVCCRILDEVSVLPLHGEDEQKGSPGEKASVKETSDEEETNSKSKGVAEEPADATKQLCEDETDSDYEDLKKLQKDFEKLLLNREDSDITLEVQGLEFPAHRSILRARSPVFNVMFKHKMKETNSDSVTIEDSDPKTFPDFLKYLYTGSTKHVSQENACQLYTTSDKYEVMQLKAKCTEFMKCNMTVETFCEYFSLAHMHTEEELIASGIEFFCANTVEIVKTAKWQIFLQENSTVGNELFLKAQSRLLTELSRLRNI